MRDSRRGLGLRWGLAALGLLALAPFGERLAALLPRCHFKALTGIPCPSCGTTRSALALAKLDVLSALAVNPLATLVWAALIGGGLAAGLMALGRRPLPRLPRPLPRRWFIAAGLLVLVNWIYLVIHGT